MSRWTSPVTSGQRALLGAFVLIVGLAIFDALLPRVSTPPPANYVLPLIGTTRLPEGPGGATAFLGSPPALPDELWGSQRSGGFLIISRWRIAPRVSPRAWYLLRSAGPARDVTVTTSGRLPAAIVLRPGRPGGPDCQMAEYQLSSRPVRIASGRCARGVSISSLQQVRSVVWRGKPALMLVLARAGARQTVDIEGGTLGTGPRLIRLRLNVPVPGAQLVAAPGAADAPPALAWVIGRRVRGENSTELHFLTPSSDYRDFGEQARTALPQPAASWSWNLVFYNPDTQVALAETPDGRRAYAINLAPQVVR